MPARGRSTRAVAEVLNESAVVSLHPRCGRCVAASHCSVDHIEATLSLVQPQLDVGSAAPREVLCPPFNIEDTVGSSATYRCENAFACPSGELVVPVWEDGVVVGGPRQTGVDPVVIHGHKLRITIRRQVHTRVIRVVEAESERECDKG